MFESTRRSFFGLGAALGIIIPPPPELPPNAQKDLGKKREECMMLLKKAYAAPMGPEGGRAFDAYVKCVREYQAQGLKHGLKIESRDWPLPEYAAVTTTTSPFQPVPPRPSWPGYPPGFVGPPQEPAPPAWWSDPSFNRRDETLRIYLGPYPVDYPIQPQPPVPPPVPTPRTRFRPSQIPQGAMLPQRFDWSSRAVPISATAAAQARPYVAPGVPFGFGPMFSSGAMSYGGPIA